MIRPPTQWDEGTIKEEFWEAGTGGSLKMEEGRQLVWRSERKFLKLMDLVSYPF